MDNEFNNNQSQPQGEPVYQQPQGEPVYQQPVPQGQTFPQQPYMQDQQAYQQAAPQTFEEFCKLPQFMKYVKNIRTCGILCFVFAVITLLASVVFAKNYAGIGDVLILVGLGVLLITKRSFAAAVALLVYAVISMVISLVTTGTPGGYLVVIAGILALSATLKLRKAWKEYQATGVLPM